MKFIRNYRINCEVDRKNLISTEAALGDCMKENAGAKWYQQPSIVIGGMVVTLGVGFFIGVLARGN